MPEPWKLWISDAKLVLAAERPFTASEEADATAALQGLLRALESLVKAAPVAPWRRALLQAWSMAAVELGGRVEPDPVVLGYSRAGVRVEVTLELERGAPITLVRIVNKLPPAEPAESSAALGVLRQLGCELRDTADGLQVARAGLVASAPALREILEAAIDLALERTQAGGPYR